MARDMILSIDMFYLKIILDFGLFAYLGWTFYKADSKTFIRLLILIAVRIIAFFMMGI